MKLEAFKPFQKNAWAQAIFGQPNIEQQIAALFASGEQGAWYDIAPQYCYQDTAGTTPAAIGDPVGLVLDRSRSKEWGVIIETSSLDSGWTSSDPRWTYSSGSVSWVGGGGTNSTTSKGYLSQSRLSGFVELSFEVSGYSGTPANNVGIDHGVLSRIPNDTAGIGIIDTRVTANGSYSFRGYWRGGGSTDGRSLVLLGRGPNNFTISNISVRELPGNHAYQTTATSRPILSRHPVTGIRNLLIYSEQFDNAAWIKGRSTITANALIAPDGTLSGYLLSDTTDSGSHVLQANQSKPASAVQYTLSFYAKAGSFPRSRILMAGFSFNDHAAATIDLENGQVDIPATVAGNFSNASVSVQDVGEGWYRIALTATSDTTSVIRYDLRIDNGTTDSYMGSGGGNIGVWGAQLDVGPVATPYQKVMSAADVTETGVASVHYLRFDGADDFMLSAYQVAPAGSLVAGWYLSEAASDSPIGAGASTISVPGARFSSGPSGELYFAVSDGVARQQNTSSGATPALPMVTLMTWDGTTLFARHNGATKVNVPQTISCAANSLAIGQADNGGSGRLNGRVYGAIALDRAITGAEIAVIERYLAQKTGVVLA